MTRKRARKMWAVFGPGEQGIIGIDVDFEMAWSKATRFEFGLEHGKLAGMKEFLEQTNYTCREVEVKELERHDPQAR